MRVIGESAGWQLASQMSASLTYRHYFEAGGCSVSGYEVPVGERCGGSCHAHECWHAALASNDLCMKEPGPKQDEAALKLCPFHVKPVVLLAFPAPTT